MIFPIPRSISCTAEILSAPGVAANGGDPILVRLPELVLDEIGKLEICASRRPSSTGSWASWTIVLAGLNGI